MTESSLVILQNEAMNDESVIDRQMNNSNHEFTISDMDGDEEIWILY